MWRYNLKAQCLASSYLCRYFSPWRARASPRKPLLPYSALPPTPRALCFPNVAIKATNLATNQSRDSKTDGSGSFSIPFLPAGDYTVTATLAGFESQKIERITLQVQQAARVDFRLKVGDVNQSVEVSAGVVALQTENATVGTVIDSGKIVDLPLNGRNFIQLAQLIPGVNPGTPGSITVRRGRGSVGQTDPSYGATAASANGMRDTANRFFLDGIETMDYDAVTYSFSPSIDSLSEFKVETSTYSAESGSAPGAQVNMITKSGTQSSSRHAMGIQPEQRSHPELRRDCRTQHNAASAEPQPVRREYRRSGHYPEGLSR